LKDNNIHSMVIASDYRVPDPDRVFPLLQRRENALADIGAHHVLVYKSADDHGRVLVTIGLRSREPIVELLRSRVFFDGFDAVGVDDIPAVFAGEIVERFDSGSPGEAAPGVVLAAIASVDDVSTLTTEVRGAMPRFNAAGIRETRIFRAFDDAHEVMILQYIDDEDRARRWIEHPDVAAQWMTGAGVGPYPPLFIGTFVGMLRIDG
jgi:heme-degrading monooxygenase HmoA